MDLNKLKVLRELNYAINKVCSLCKHSNFHPNTNWGSCNLHEYEHLKHTGPARNLSIHKAGSCSSFEANEDELALLGAFEEFLEL